MGRTGPASAQKAERPKQGVCWLSPQYSSQPSFANPGRRLQWVSLSSSSRISAVTCALERKQKAACCQLWRKMEERWNQKYCVGQHPGPERSEQVPSQLSFPLTPGSPRHACAFEPCLTQALCPVHISLAGSAHALLWMPSALLGSEL